LEVETGLLAGQANGAVTVRYGDTVVLATAVMSKTASKISGYFPLMVDFEERYYAAGKIKGSRFIKREGRPSDDAILSGRAVDRTIRPLFNHRMRNDVQVVVTVLSYDGENDPDIISITAASAALCSASAATASPSTLPSAAWVSSCFSCRVSTWDVHASRSVLTRSKAA